MALRRLVARETRAAVRGFSLIELLVVVMIVGILAALAIPSMSTATYDRQVYNDAGAVMQLMREARTRAVARGAAELITMTTQSNSTDRGTFQLWEAVAVDPTGTGANRLPVPNCTLPTNWSPLSAANAGIVLIDGVNLNTGTSSVEAMADIETQFWVYQDPTSNTQTQFKNGYLCYTPLGRSYVSTDAGSSASNVITAQPVFEGALPTVGVLEVDVVRKVGNSQVGTIRSVLLPPNGMARLFSHTS